VHHDAPTGKADGALRPHRDAPYRNSSRSQTRSGSGDRVEGTGDKGRLQQTPRRPPAEPCLPEEEDKRVRTLSPRIAGSLSKRQGDPAVFVFSLPFTSTIEYPATSLLDWR